MRQATATGPEIAVIEARVRTSSLQGTNGFVYLGIAGREFLLDNSGNDFKPGSDILFTLGLKPTVRKHELNDPRLPRLRVDDLTTFPVYLRFEPRIASDQWYLDETTVTVNPGDNPITFRAVMLEKSPGIPPRDFALVLGQSTGKTCFLRRL